MSEIRPLGVPDYLEVPEDHTRRETNIPARSPESGVIRPFRRIHLDLDAPAVPVEILVRFLYAARLTVLQSEPGVGKSWLATWLTKLTLDAGQAVVYIDEEGGPDLITERLAALGADTRAVADRFFYFAFEGRQWAEADLEALDDLIAFVGPNLALGVLDSLPDFLAAANRSEDSAQDVTDFLLRVCGRFRVAGAAQLLLDHLPKPAVSGKRERSRYSRGSGAKLAKADATLLLETVDEFDVKTSGKVRLWKTKDRRGRLELPPLSKPGYDLAVMVGDGALAFTEPPEDAAPAWDGPTACMAAVSAVLKDEAGTEFSKTALVTRLRALGHAFRESTITESAERLALLGELTHRKGPRGADLYCFRSGGQVQHQGLEWDPLEGS